MTDDGAPARSRNDVLGYAALALAVVVALGVAAFFLLGGDDDDDPPAATDVPGRPTTQAGTGPLDPERPEVGKAAPDFALVDARDPSRTAKLSDYRGKVVLLNWFASWCEPCKREIPAFLAAEAALGDDLVILGVDYLESADKATGILDELGAAYPAVLDSSGAVAEHYRVAGMPTTFLVDREGTLVAARTGELKEDALGEFLAKAGLTYTP